MYLLLYIEQVLIHTLIDTPEDLIAPLLLFLLATLATTLVFTLILVKYLFEEWLVYPESVEVRVETLLVFDWVNQVESVVDGFFVFWQLVTVVVDGTFKNLVIVDFQDNTLVAHIELNKLPIQFFAVILFLKGSPQSGVKRDHGDVDFLRLVRCVVLITARSQHFKFEVLGAGCHPLELNYIASLGTTPSQCD